MIAGKSTVDGRAVEITVCRGERLTCGGAVGSRHGDHGITAIMVESALVDLHPPR